MKKYLLVCEGKSDFFLLDELAKEISQTRGEEVKISPISPKQDATSGNWPRHGWTEVRKWCKQYSRNKTSPSTPHSAQLLNQARRKNWPAILTISRADGIIIQIDTDIAEQIQDSTPQFTGTPDQRLSFCKRAILHWLNESTEPQEIFPVLPNQNIETWILSTYSRTHTIFSDLNNNFKYLDLSDSQDRLINAGHPASNARLIKGETQYRHNGRSIHQNLEQVKRECPEINDFCNLILAT